MITKFTEHCVICNREVEEIHHLCFGRGIRPLADADGLTAPICRICHSELHHNTIANELSKICGQLLFEKNLIEKEGISGDEARDRFRERYSRSYL